MFWPEASALARRDWTAADASSALARDRFDLPSVAALLSPAAAPALEEMAQRARHTTLAHFGRTIRFFAPMYVSNECVTTCTYCGFSATNLDIVRKTLAPSEALAEARSLLSRGFRHLLLVSGEHPRIVSRDYLTDVISTLAPEVPSISVEVQVWDTETYRRLVSAGCEGLVVYQETYDRDTYAAVHRKGKKQNYDWRLAACDRGAEAGMRKLGIAALLGLHDDWRFDAIALAAHARALVRRWWRCEVSVSLPRLRPAAGGFLPAGPVGDRGFVQLLFALFLMLPELGITLSTRETLELRDALLRLGVTLKSVAVHL